MTINIAAAAHADLLAAHDEVHGAANYAKAAQVAADRYAIALGNSGDEDIALGDDIAWAAAARTSSALKAYEAALSVYHNIVRNAYRRSERRGVLWTG